MKSEERTAKNEERRIESENRATGGEEDEPHAPRGGNLAERLLAFAVAILKLVDTSPKTFAGRHVGGELVRAGTSAGANCEEVCAAESRRDFIHRMHIVYKELREARFWLRVSVRAAFGDPPECQRLLRESEELCRMVASSLVTAKKNR